MTRPWEASVGSRPWETAQPLYPRTITVTRPVGASTSGLVSYSGDVETSETVIASSVRANVSVSGAGRGAGNTGLPGDSPGPVKWLIAIPVSALATLPLIMERDVIYDDLGRRFQVSAFDPETAGAQIDAVRLLA